MTGTWKPSTRNRVRDVPPAMTDEFLRESIAQAIAWCDPLVGPLSLRSKEIAPGPFDDGLDERVVHELCSLRGGELHRRALAIARGLPLAVAGRFMVYFPDESLRDGYAELVSLGFFDVDNVPAWDTWVSFHVEDDASWPHPRRYVLCYVPAALVDLADEGIDGNPEQCIEWLDRSDVQIRERVAALTRAIDR